MPRALAGGLGAGERLLAAARINNFQAEARWVVLGKQDLYNIPKPFKALELNTNRIDLLSWL